MPPAAPAVPCKPAAAIAAIQDRGPRTAVRPGIRWRSPSASWRVSDGPRENEGIRSARPTRRWTMDQPRVDDVARRLAAASTRRHLLEHWLRSSLEETAPRLARDPLPRGAATPATRAGNGGNAPAPSSARTINAALRRGANASPMAIAVRPLVMPTAANACARSPSIPRPAAVAAGRWSRRASTIGAAMKRAAPARAPASAAAAVAAMARAASPVAAARTPTSARPPRATRRVSAVGLPMPARSSSVVPAVSSIENFAATGSPVVRRRGQREDRPKSRAIRRTPQRMLIPRQRSPANSPTAHKPSVSAQVDKMVS